MDARAGSRAGVTCCHNHVWVSIDQHGRSWEFVRQAASATRSIKPSALVNGGNAQQAGDCFSLALVGARSRTGAKSPVSVALGVAWLTFVTAFVQGTKVMEFGRVFSLRTKTVDGYCRGST